MTLFCSSAVVPCSPVMSETGPKLENEPAAWQATSIIPVLTLKAYYMQDLSVVVGKYNSKWTLKECGPRVVWDNFCCELAFYE